MKTKYTHLKDSDLLTQTAKAAATEKEAMLALLEYLVEVDLRKLYAAKAYSTLFEYLVKELGFSEPAASERVSAVRLMRSVPEVKDHLEAGRLTLTSAAQIQRFIKTEEKVADTKIDVTEKIEIIASCLDQSKREVERVLLGKQSTEANILAKEKIRTLTETRSEIKFSVNEQTLQKLERIKQLIGDESLESIFDRALESLLLKEQKRRGMEEVPEETVFQPAQNPQEKTQPAGFKVHDPYSRFIPIHLKRFVFKRSKGRCEFIDPETNQRCESRFKLELEHRIPFAVGGRTDEENLMHLCRSHNARAAIEAGLGRNAKRGE